LTLLLGHLICIKPSQFSGGARPSKQAVIAGHYECKAGWPGQWSFNFVLDDHGLFSKLESEVL